MHLTKVFESIEAKYWVSWLRFYFNKREYELSKLLWIRHFVQQPLTQNRGDRMAKRRISAVSRKIEKLVNKRLNCKPGQKYMWYTLKMRNAFNIAPCLMAKAALFPKRGPPPCPHTMLLQGETLWAPWLNIVWGEEEWGVKRSEKDKCTMTRRIVNVQTTIGAGPGPRHYHELQSHVKARSHVRFFMRFWCDFAYKTYQDYPTRVFSRATLPRNTVKLAEVGKVSSNNMW